MSVQVITHLHLIKKAMKSTLVFKWATLMLQVMIGCGAFGQSIVKPKNISFSQLAAQFKTPDKAFGSAPLWVWNADITKGKIDSMLPEFKANAFGGVFIHPRPGLITPYLSERWLERFDYAVKKGKELGLEVWIYDENSYPSGFAGGHVPEEMPSSYNQGQMLHLRKSDVFNTSDPAVIALKQTGTGFEKVDTKGNNPKGNYYLFDKRSYEKSPWYGGYSYVDVMVKGVTEKFIDVTMKGYEKYFGDEFGKTVPGVFSDEPNIEVQGKNNIRWTPDLFEVFKKRWGYDLESQLPSLFEEVGPWRKVRHNYYQVLLQLFIDRWSKPYYNYTNAKNLQWTGHYWEHGWPSPNMGGDNMAMYAWHQRPGIDMLFNQFDERSPNAQFGNVRSVKELASVANQLGKKRTLSETYGGGGWELTFQDMKRLGDWEFVLGVNSLNQHLSYMTLVGARKYDYPQSFSYHNPCWPYYAPLNRYFSRLSLALSSGNQVNDILILEPTTAAWMYSTFEKPNKRRDEIGQEFQSFVTTLEKRQIEYDLGSENIIKDHGKTANKVFVVGNRSYAKVIIPPGMENLDRKTADLLRQFAERGGQLIVYQKVRYIDGVEAEKDLTFINKRMRKFVPGDKATLESLMSKDIVFGKPGLLTGKLYHQRRTLADGEVLFLVNSSLEEDVKGSFQLKKKNVLLLDVMDGKIYQYPVKVTGTGREVAYHLPPAGSLLFFSTDAKTGKYPVYQVPAKALGNKIHAETKIKYMEPNVLTLDFVDVGFGAASLKDMQVYQASDTIFKHFGFSDGNPWNTSVQYKDNTIKRDTLQHSGGFKVDYHFAIKDHVDFKDFNIAIERPWLWEIQLNGKPLEERTGGWYLDKEIVVFKAGKGLKAGNNTLSLIARRMRVHSEVEPVYVLGDFNLASANKGFEIISASEPAIGSWKTMGRPLYGKLVSYKKVFRAEKNKAYTIKLKKWKGTAAILLLNGKKIGDLSYAPYEFTVKDGLKVGENVIDVQVVGSLKNTLGPHHNNPKPGLVSPWLWRGVKEYPPGADYDVYDYGLMQDFEILESK
jgi:hypothetical protein